jgi:hypothetical protein
MSTRVHVLRARRRAESTRRRAESAARFQTMLTRLESQWREQLQFKNPAHVTRRAGGDKHEPQKEQKNEHEL